MDLSDPYSEPIIDWNQKPIAKSNFDDTIPIHPREIISPSIILNEIRDDSKPTQTEFQFDNMPRKEFKKIDSYEHERGWKNRMIAGDSLAIMQSLLQRENMAGQVQMIYFDPPYGIRFGSNFQPFINKRDVKDRDEDLSREIETIKAFRDTWERGIHSYLSYIYERVSMARGLLSDSGSLFFQIGDENVHRIRMILDEIFGSQNLVAQICFRKKGMPLGASYLETMNDYLLWYANDKKQLKYHQLFVEKDISEDHHWNMVELPNGTRRAMTRAEMLDPNAFEKNSRKFQYIGLNPAGVNENSIFPVIFNGKKITPPRGKSWKTSEEGMKRLIEAKRVDFPPGGNTLRYIQYFDDYPVAALTNFWNDTGGDTDKLYTVQTAKKVLRRCILMSTDPEDLVLDITCGSGTTAFVAEQFGRRWITCDTSRIAIEIARERIATATFDWYKLANKSIGLRGGFEYKTVPHITLKSIANNQPPETEILFDQPLIDSKKIRVASEFKVESLPSPIVMSLDSAARGYGDEWMTFFSQQVATIDGRKGEKIALSGISPIEEESHFNAIAETDRAKVAWILFGSSNQAMDLKSVEDCIEEARRKKSKIDYAIFAAFQFNPDAEELIDTTKIPNVEVLRVLMSSELMNQDLKKSTKTDQALMLVGQPDIEVKNLPDGKIVVKVKGFDYFNIKENKVESGSDRNVALWMLDPKYDGEVFKPTKMFFPMKDPSRGWEQVARTLKEEIDMKKLAQFSTLESCPFESENGVVAIKIIDDRGLESMRVLKIKKEV